MRPMTLHPAFRAYLDQLEPIVAQAREDGIPATPESARAALAGLLQFTEPSVEVAHVFDSAVSYRESNVEVRVPVRVYVPCPNEATDVILFVHGGGHMAGDLDVYDFSARRTAVASGMTVVSVDYRRSPEAPFPLGLTDTYQVLRHLEEVLVDVTTSGRIHAVADSGGAAKLASIAMRVAAGEWESPIERQVLMYPSLDYTMSGESITTFGSGYFLDAERVAWYFDNYFPTGTNRAAASPILGPIDQNMPETLVIAAEYDPLLSEAQEYVRRVQDAGSSAELLVAPGMIHAYMFFEKFVPDVVDQTYRVLSDFLQTGTAQWTRS